MRRIYSLNEKFFEDIASEKQAYWLGFVTADGGIVNSNLIVNLAGKDRDHLVKMGRDLGFSGPVKDRISRIGIREYSRASLVVSSKKLTTDLRNKTKEDVPVEFILDYWRGVFDGDGHIGKDTSNKWRIRLVGSHPIVTGFADWARPICHSSANVLPHCSIWAYEVKGMSMPQSLIREIYGSAEVALDRKQLLAEELILSKPKRRRVMPGGAN